MIYKFKKWVILPAYTEIFINASSDAEALKIVKAIDSKNIKLGRSRCCGSSYDL